MSQAIQDLKDFLSKSPSVVFPDEVLEYVDAIEIENAKLRELLSMYISFARTVARGSTIQNAYPEGPGERMNETEMRERALELGVKGCM